MVLNLKFICLGYTCQRNLYITMFIYFQILGKKQKQILYQVKGTELPIMPVISHHMLLLCPSKSQKTDVGTLLTHHYSVHPSVNPM